jgi:hypothetical protein
VSKAGSKEIDNRCQFPGLSGISFSFLPASAKLLDIRGQKSGNGHRVKINVIGLISVPLFTNFLVPKLAAPPTLRNDPAVTICKAMAIAERAMQTIEGTLPPPPAGNPRARLQGYRAAIF